MILETADPLPEGVRTVDHAQELFNSVWTVSLAPLRPWYLQISLWLGVAVSLLVALLAAAGVYYAGPAAAAAAGKNPSGPSSSCRSSWSGNRAICC